MKFKQKYTKEISFGGEIISAIINSLICSIILYLVLTKYNEPLREYLEMISTNGIALKITLIAFPLLFIISGMLTLGRNLTVIAQKGQNK